MDEMDVNERWSEYIEHLFSDNRPEINRDNVGKEGLEIFQGEVRKALGTRYQLSKG